MNPAIALLGFWLLCAYWCFRVDKEAERASVDMERARRQVVEAKLRDARRELESLKFAHGFVFNENAELFLEVERLRASR